MNTKIIEGSSGRWLLDWPDGIDLHFGSKTQFYALRILPVFDINEQYKEYVNWEIIDMKREDNNGNPAPLQSWTRGDPSFLLSHVDTKFDEEDVPTDLGTAKVIGVVNGADFGKTRVTIKFDYPLLTRLKELPK